MVCLPVSPAPPWPLGRHWTVRLSQQIDPAMVEAPTPQDEISDPISNPHSPSVPRGPRGTIRHHSTPRAAVPPGQEGDTCVLMLWVKGPTLQNINDNICNCVEPESVHPLALVAPFQPKLELSSNPGSVLTGCVALGEIPHLQSHGFLVGIARLSHGPHVSLARELLM
jgi:hypothetical protein